MSVFKSLFQKCYQSQPNQIQITIKIGLSLFIGGSLLFLILKQWLSNNTLTTYFSLLSGLATIFAACVALIVFQDYKQQKQAEVLAKLAEEKQLKFDPIAIKLINLSNFIDIHCFNFNIYFNNNNKKLLIEYKEEILIKKADEIYK